MHNGDEFATEREGEETEVREEKNIENSINETRLIEITTIEFEQTPESEEIFRKANKKTQIQMLRMLQGLRPKAKNQTIEISKNDLDESIAPNLIAGDVDVKTQEPGKATATIREQRTDGGSLEEQCRLSRQVIEEMRAFLRAARENESRQGKRAETRSKGVRLEQTTQQARADNEGRDPPHGYFSEVESNASDEELRERRRRRTTGVGDYNQPTHHMFIDRAGNASGYERRYGYAEVPQFRSQQNVLTTFNHLASTIPLFDGDSASLPLFEKMVRMAARSVEPSYESFFVGALANRLKGKAAMYFAPRLTQFETIDEFLSELARRYGNIGNPEAELAKLRAVHQRRGEGLENYCNRVEAIFNRVTLLYDSNPSLSLMQKAALKITAEQEAMKQFRYGLGTPYSYMVSNSTPDSLSQAIVDVLRIESDLNMRYPAQDREVRVHYAREGEKLQPYEKGGYDYKQTGETELDEWDGVDGDFKLCLYCNKYGPHSTRECRKLLSDAKSGRIKDPDAVVEEPSAKATTERQKQSPAQKKECDYCGWKNHNTSECRILLRDVRDGRIKRERGTNTRRNTPNHGRGDPRMESGRRPDGARRNDAPPPQR